MVTAQRHDDDDDSVSERVLAALTKWQQRHVLAVLQRTDGSDSALRAQLLHFERWYRGGLDTYLGNATRLFHAQQHGAAVHAVDDPDALVQDEYADWLPSVPRVAPWSSTDSEDSDASPPPQVAHLDSLLYRDLEALGLQHIGESAFVVVAGGLGERLGYDGIKLKLPVETLTHTSYLEMYIQQLLALQALANTVRGSDAIHIPLAIMTSDVTHDATHEFLVANAYFGMHEQQVALLRQEKVPCLNVDSSGDSGDDDASPRLQLALTIADGSGAAASPLLVMKPHGHGDVHALLHSSGLAFTWQHEQRKRYVHFFQDTNALIVHSFLPLLGAAVHNDWAFVFTSVQRKAKDASGAVVRFVQPSSSQSPSPSTADTSEPLTALFNVEYHELDAFLRTKARAAFPDGDANDTHSGFSLFPGNINHVVVELASYAAVLRASGGFVPEVFNPKYAPSRAQFTSPARLECMLQDYPKLLVRCRDALPRKRAQHGIGLVLFPPDLVYSPCKNDVASARVKAAHDIPPQCAGSAEHDFFAVNRARLAAVGIAFEPPLSLHTRTEWLGIPLDCAGPQLVLAPQFAPTQALLRTRFPAPARVRISRHSTLLIDGDVTFEALELDGALRITACAGARVVVKSLRVTNAGYEYASVSTQQQLDPIDAMRGYVLRQLAARELVFDAPGDYTVDDDNNDDDAAA